LPLEIVVEVAAEIVRTRRFYVEINGADPNSVEICGYDADELRYEYRGRAGSMDGVDAAMRYLKTRSAGIAGRSRPACRTRVNRALPRRTRTRARRSHRVGHAVAKSSSGDSGDGDPEPEPSRPRRVSTIGGAP
jgi:hypothetical protein